jgi:1-acyl-sn-glycerol-3-phosphate acyltransferase
MARILAALALFAIITPIHLVTKALLGRSPWPSRFLSAMAWAMGARVEVKGEAVGRHTLIVANHTSWFDILILGGSLKSAFVAKDDLGHGFIHWLADQNGTIYVKRSHVRGARDQAIALARALEGQQPVAIFPETTTGPGTRLLPFRSALLEAANFADRNVEIRPVAIDYGTARAEFGWFDNEPGMDNVMRLIGRRGTLTVTIHVLPALDRSLDRKQLTQAAREAIAQTLDLTSHDHSPIGGER